MDGQQPRNFSIGGVCTNGMACSQPPFNFGASYMACCSDLTIESFASDQDIVNNVESNCYTCSGKNIQPVCSTGTCHVA